MSKDVQTLFSEIAPRYDLINSVLSLHIDRRWRREAIAAVNGNPHKVLDLCAGTLALSAMLLKKNPYCQITAVDFSEAMLQAGLKKIPYGYLSRLKIETGDAMALPYPAHSFDAVMCAYGMRNLDDNCKALVGLHRVLKPGGKLVILDFFAPDGWMSRLFHATYGNLFVPTIGRLISRHRNAYRYLRDSIQGFYTPAAYAELLKSVGFQGVTLKRQTGGISCLVKGESAI